MGKESTCNTGDIGVMGLTPGSGRFPGGGNATYCSIHAWKIPLIEETGRLKPMGSQKGRTPLVTKQQQYSFPKMGEHFSYSNLGLIQFSVDGCGSVPLLLFELRPNYGGGNGDDGDLLLKVPCMHCYTQCP